MNRLVAAGVTMVGLGLVGYAVGLAVAYPARAFSVTAVMVGLTLVAIRHAGVVG